MVTVPCLITVATGVLAPGHLGELTRYVPFELVDDVLAGTRTVQRRVRAVIRRRGSPPLLAGSPSGPTAGCSPAAAQPA